MLFHIVLSTTIMFFFSNHQTCQACKSCHNRLKSLLYYILLLRRTVSESPNKIKYDQLRFQREKHVSVFSHSNHITQ